MPRAIGNFTVLQEREISSSSRGGKTSQLLCAEIADDCGHVLVWTEVQGEEPQIIGRYSPHSHEFTTAKELTMAKRTIDHSGRDVPRKTEKSDVATSEQETPVNPENIRLLKETAMNQPFRRITKVTPKIANNWQKYYVCMYQAERVKTPFCGVVLETRGEFDWWTRLLQDTWQLSCEVFHRQFGTPDDDNSMPLAAIYASGWVLIERKDSVEVGVLVDRNEEHKTRLEIATKISHLATGQLAGNTFTARLNEQIEMETPDCRISMTITEVPMKGGA